MQRVLVPWENQLVVAWVRALDVGDMVDAWVRAEVGEGSAVVEGFESELRVAVCFASVQGTILVEADGIGHLRCCACGEILFECVERVGFCVAEHF